MDTPAASSNLRWEVHESPYQGFSTVWKILWITRNPQVDDTECLFDLRETAGRGLVIDD